MSTQQLSCLAYTESPYGLWTEKIDSKTGLQVPGVGSSRFYRFNGKVRLDKIFIPLVKPHLAGPQMQTPGRPRHIIVSTYDENLSRCVVLDEELPDSLLAEPLTLDLHGVQSSLLSVVCDSQYPGSRGFSLFYPSTWTVPFIILADMKLYGEIIEEKVTEPPYCQPLKQIGISPSAPTEMEIQQDHYTVTYKSRYLQVSFSRLRPMITFLGWNAFGRGEIKNAILSKRSRRGFSIPNSGPFIRTATNDWDCNLIGGTLEISGNSVIYRDIELCNGCKISVVFTINEKRMEMHITQDTAHDMRLIDCAIWAFSWDGVKIPPLTTLAMPIRGKRRNGGVYPKGAWDIPGYGNLSFSPKDDAETLEFQTDISGWFGRTAVTGLQLNTHHLDDGSVMLKQGQSSTTLQFEVNEIKLKSERVSTDIPQGLKQCWGTMFAFRPENAGFSNNGFSLNCKSCIYLPADLAAYTDCSTSTFDVVELLKYSVSLALQGGPGYGSCLEESHDTAPAMLIAATQAHRLTPDPEWLRQLWPYINMHLDHILEHIDQNGMYINTVRSGNSGKKEWSSNAIDIICYGHTDGYANALAYRALMGMAATAKSIDHGKVSEQCIHVASRMREAYVPTLFNEVTGWLAGWRSLDGQLHDHCDLIVNGMAICYGLVDDNLAWSIIKNIEKARIDAGIVDFTYGLPWTVLPIPRDDYAGNTSGEPLRKDGLDTYGVFGNSMLNPAGIYYYVRALSKLGFGDTADRICRQMLASFANRVFDGEVGTGTEGFSHEGLPTGYEGTLTHCYHVLLAFAQHLGIVETMEPEWWPAV